MPEIIGAAQRIIVPNSRQTIQIIGYGPKGDAGPTGPQGPAGHMAAGDIVTTVNTVLPSDRWFWLDGSTIVNCAVNYPELWSAAPVAWRSGSDLVLPDMDATVLMGESTGSPAIGSLGGSSSVTIATANLPSHAHGNGTMVVDPASFNIDLAAFNATLPNHVHTMAHTHQSGINRGTSGGGYGLLDNGSASANGPWGTAGSSAANTGNPTTLPSISINVPTFAVNVPSTAVTGTMASVGSGTALALPLPPNMRVKIRIYAGEG